MIEIACANCGNQGSVDDARAGTSVRCRRCGHAIKVHGRQANPFDMIDADGNGEITERGSLRQPDSLPWFYSILTAISYCVAIIGSLIIWASFAFVCVAARGEGRDLVGYYFVACMISQLGVLFLPALILLLVDIGTVLHVVARRR
jgi:DNA-directed RNA polymerase subunit RPC12/RpoP